MIRAAVEVLSDSRSFITGSVSVTSSVDTFLNGPTLSVTLLRVSWSWVRWNETSRSDRFALTSVQLRIFVTTP